MSPIRTLGFLSAIGCVFAMLTGCSTCDIAFRKVASQASDPAAKFSVTAISHGDWNTYQAKLQPAFKADADRALGEVLATTMRTEEKEIRATAAALGIALPGSGSVLQPQGTDAPESPLPTASSLPGIAQLGSADLDPMTKYQLATSLFQEIQLLNSYVQDASIPFGFRAYVVRLNLGVMTFKPNQPIDIYTTLSFFDGVEGIDGGRVPLFKPTDKRGASGLLENRIAYSTIFPGHTRVIPMLATDAVETALQSRSSDRIRDLAFSLSGGLPDVVGGSLSVADRMDRLRSLLARDYNTTYQVFHETENSILVKIGAANNASSGRAMVSRTFPVTLILLVPDKLWDPCRDLYPRINILAKMTLRDANTGAVIEGSNVLARSLGVFESVADLNMATDDFARLKSNLCEQIKRRKANNVALHDAPRSSEILDSDFMKILLAINDNDYAEYRKILQNYPDLDRFNEEVWTLLVEAVTETGYSQTSLSLRSEPKPSRSLSNHKPVAIDNGKTTSVTIGGFRGVSDAGKIRSDLIVASGGEDFMLPHQSAAISNAGSVVVLQFESLKKLGLPGANVRFRTQWYDSDAQDWEDIGAMVEAGYRLIPIPPNPSPFKIEPNIKVITARHGEEGSIRFALVRDRAVPLPNGKISIRVTGGELEGIDASSGTVFQIKGNALVADGAAIGNERDVQILLSNFHASPEIELRLYSGTKPIGASTKIAVKVQK